MKENNKTLKCLTTKTYTFTTEDGTVKTVEKKRGKGLLFLALFLLVFFICFMFTKGNKAVRWGEINKIIPQLFTPSKWSLKTNEGYQNYLFNTAVPRIWDTVKMVYIATIIGTLISVPLYIF